MTINTELNKLEKNVKDSWGILSTSELVSGITHNLENIPKAIRKIAGLEAKFARVHYYSVFSVEWEEQGAEMCTINSIDETKLDTFIRENAHLGSYDNANFDYENDGETAKWVFHGRTTAEIAPEDMLATTGIDVTVEEGADWAYFFLMKETTVDLTSPVIEREAASLEEVNTFSNSVFTVDGLEIPRIAVQSVEVGTQVETTPNSFLTSCQNLESVSFLGSEVVIGNSFCQSCQKLNTPIDVSIATSIGTFFLNGCTSFNSQITLPNTLPAISDGFMQGCRAFNQPLTLPGGIASIGGSFLNNCTNLNQPLVIPDTATSLGAYFMQNCTSFSQILTLSGSLTSIGTNFLSGCTNFNQNIALPGSIVSIGANFMYNCKSMSKTIDVGTLDASVAATSNNTLATNDNQSAQYLSNITIKGEKADTWISRFPIRTSSSPYRYLMVWRDVPANSLVTTSGDVYPLTEEDVPNLWASSSQYVIGGQSIDRGNVYGVDISGLNIERLDDRFLFNCENLKVVRLADTITTIGDKCLCVGNGQHTSKLGRASLTCPLNLPSSLISIGTGFLMNQHFFREPLTFPDSLKSIGNEFMLANVTFNQPIVFPNGLESIGSWFLAGTGYAGIEGVFNQEIVIPNTVVSLGNQFLYQQEEFNSPITLSENLTELTTFLSGCASFNQPLRIPTGITSLNGFLSGCASFNQNISLPDTITIINTQSGFLSGCDAMTSEVDVGSLPASVIQGNYKYMTLATTNQEAPTYVTGITLRGDNVDDWKTALPDLNGETHYSTSYYRKLKKAE